MPFGSKQPALNQPPAKGRAKRNAQRGSKAVKTRKGRGKQFVLLIGDEGAILVFMEGAKVVRRLFAPTPQPSSTEALVQLMQSNPGIPLSILVDTIDQQYVRQSFPPVSQLSVGSLVRRRLDRDFQTDDLKNYLPINRDKTGRKEWNFLLIAAARTASLKEWLELVLELPNEFKGIYLVPIEAAHYITALRNTLSFPTRPWQLLVSHNKVSGFRQVVTQNGKLTFTRVTQAIDDAIPAVIAGNIEQEIINTLEYLRRLGFQDLTSLDVTVIASNDVTEVIDLKRFNVGNALAFTPLEVSEALGFEQAALSADRFGDVVMAASFLHTKKHILKFSTAYANTLAQLYTIRRAVKAITALAILALLGLSVQNILGTLENQALTQTSKNKQSSARNEHVELQARVNGLNENLAYKSAVVSTYDVYEKIMFSPTQFMAQLSPVITPETRLAAIDWNANKTNVSSANSPSTSNASAASRGNTTKEDAAPVTIKAEFEMKGNYADTETLEKAELAFVAQLSSAFPDYSVTHEPFPWQKDAQKTVEISFDQRQNNAVKEGNNRLIVLFNGPKQAPAPAKPTPGRGRNAR